MKIHTFFKLKWKSFIRHPFFEQILVFNLLKGIYLFLFLSFIYFLGLFLNQFTNHLLGKVNGVLIIFLFLAFASLFLDFIIKFFFKRSEFDFSNFRRFPQSNKSIFVYSIVKEIFSIWNIYLTIFFFHF
jgi:hypothetical protein